MSGNCSAVTIERLRCAFNHDPELLLSAQELVARLGTKTRNAAHVMISNAGRAKVLERGGRYSRYCYRLAIPGRRDPLQVESGGDREAHDRVKHDRVDAAPAIPYRGPAFDSGPLLQHVGTAWEGELEPCVGARIVDSLHAQFQREFGAIE